MKAPGTLFSLTVQGFLPAFFLQASSQACAFSFHTWPHVWESRADPRRTWFSPPPFCTPETGEWLSPRPSGAKMYQIHNMDIVLEGEQMWPLMFQMIGRLPALKEAPGPAEPVPRITNRRLDSTLASLPPNAWLTGF